jgi:glycine/D-amino acid oxidase-like deaminating enzyme
MSAAARRVHGDGGVFYAGAWVDIEDLGAKQWCPSVAASDATRIPPPAPLHEGYDADVLIVGAGCVGAAIARELSKTTARVVLMDASDDVTQGATKGNSGIVHAGFDDAPGSVRAELCWQGNQLFTQLDRELRFGLQRNGSLVVARGAEDEAVLRELLARGAKNGVQRLRIVGREELRAMEPHIAADATAALFSPDAATLTPYEFTIALAENAVDNGVELRLNSRLEALAPLPGGGFTAAVREGGRPSLRAARRRRAPPAALALAATGACLALLGVAALLRPALLAGVLPAAGGGGWSPPWLLLPRGAPAVPFASILLSLGCLGASAYFLGRGGAGARRAGAAPRGAYTLRARYVVNAAGEGSGDVARLLGDDSFSIKPRIGEYLLLNKEQGHKVRPGRLARAHRRHPPSPTPPPLTHPPPRAAARRQPRHRRPTTFCSPRPPRWARACSCKRRCGATSSWAPPPRTCRTPPRRGAARRRLAPPSSRAAATWCPPLTPPR